MKALAEGLVLHLQVIHALVLRETRTRYGGYRLGYLWAFVSPLTWVALFAGMFYLMERRPPPYGMDEIGFLTTGVVPFFLYSKSQTQANSAIAANKGLLYYPQVRPLDLVASRVLLEFATSVVVFLTFMGASALLLDGTLDVDEPLLVIEGLLLATALGASLGLLICSLVVFFPTVANLHGPLFRPLFWISGLFFTAEQMPTPLRDYLLYNPVLHCVELVRAGWFASYRDVFADASYVLVWVVVLLFFALTLERVARRRIRMA
jgi:capsular polysaccharide transport system permease protein